MTPGNTVFYHDHGKVIFTKFSHDIFLEFVTQTPISLFWLKSPGNPLLYHNHKKAISTKYSHTIFSNFIIENSISPLDFIRKMPPL